MFATFADFFIKNSKLTIVFIIVTLISWIGSYFMIPKQYNPTIIAPAFHIFISSPSMSSWENQRLIMNELENKLMEIEWIDEVFWTAWDNYIWVMAKFHVWENAENAKIRLNQKLSQNMDLKPIGVENPIIKTLNPDELPQITYAISYVWSGNISHQEKQIYLRQVANTIKEELKVIKNVTTLEIIGWIKNNIVISLDLEKIESLHTDIMEIYQVLKNNDLSLPNGNFHLNNGERVFIETSWKLNTIEALKKLIISNRNGKIIYLWDIASFSHWEKRLSSYTIFSQKENIWSPSVLLWVWKQVGTNGVSVTKEIKKQMEIIKNNLPSDIKISIIQDEWEEAALATGHLITDLIQSIIIVVIILIFFLGWKNALNTATSIPLILSLVFLYAFIVWYDINRISLFALILVIWMLVDDSIVVVENIHRHLEERKHTGKNKKDAILEAVQEVWPGVILSTVTKILSFAGMFAVTGMMWEYMWPIPKFAIIALIFSIIVAFSINPWVSYLMSSNITEESKKEPGKKKNKFDIRHIYLKIMNIFIRDDKKASRNRKIFKVTFWISLFLVIILPISFGIFKARMLPKSNKDQVYLWIDAPRGTSVEKMLQIEKSVQDFFLNNEKLPLDLKITKNISSSIGIPFMWDFANLFRWWWDRKDENQISSRINLLPKEEYKQRIKSEIFTFEIRPLLREYLLSRYPDIKIRLLEDPPGPPVRATFMIKIKWWDGEQQLENFTQKVFQEVKKREISDKLADVWNSLSTTYRKINIVLDHESISRAWLDINQIAQSIAIAKNTTKINVIQDKNSLEASYILLWVKNELSESQELLEKISFTNPEGIKIPLSSIATIQYDFVNPEINTDSREKTHFIYAEMWDNSVVYPIITLMWILKSDTFLDGKYEVINSSFYDITYKGIQDGKIYTLEWDGEWKLTMDTFRDLGTAMIIAILTIYFLIVWQFRSFAVAGIVMLPFLLGFFGIFPWFSLLYLLKNEYFNATGMIWVISLAGIVVGNAILLVDYIDILKKQWWTIEKAIINAGYIRFMPIMLTSIAAIFWAIKITSDPVWSGLARSIVWWLSTSAILTLIAIPIFYYESQKKSWNKCMEENNMKC